MTGRVLNFSEFQEKYSTDAQQDSAAAYSDLSTASDNFQTAFDDTSYDSPQLGPKRPVSGMGEMTPAQPGDMGAPAFNPNASGMEAPEDVEDADASTETNPTFGNYDPASSGDPEEGDDDEDDDDEEEEEDDNEDEDEEEDKKENTNESRFWNKRRSSVILESFDSFTEEDPYASIDVAGIDPYAEELEDPYAEESGNWVKCRSCGDTKEIPAGHDPFHPSNVDDPNEWWQGAEFGMQCGCNM